MAAVLVAFAVVVVLLFGGGGGHKYTLLFQTGGQLVPGNEVLVAGQRVGTIDSIDLTDDNQAAVEVTMEEPLREGTTAVIRPTSLSGVANRYISLTPGPNNSPEIEEGSTITGEDTTAPVDIDQLFNIFRPRDRAALQKFIQGNATVYAGKGVLANRAYKFLNPALSTSDEAVRGALERLGLALPVPRLRLADVRRARRPARGPDVAGLQRERDAGGDRQPQRRPRPLAGGAAGDAAADQHDVRQPPHDPRRPRPARRGLLPGDEAPRAVPAARPPRSPTTAPDLHEARRHRRLPGQNNDLADTLKKLPTVKQRADGAAGRDQGDGRLPGRSGLPAALHPDILAWLSKFGAVTAYYDGNSHYARVQPAGANTFDYNTATNVLTGHYQAAYTGPPPQYPAANSLPYSRPPATSAARAAVRAGPRRLEPVRRPRLANSGLTPSDCNPDWLPTARPGP